MQIDKNTLIDAIRHAFPEFPVPTMQFWNRDGFDECSEIARELSARFGECSWSQSSVENWLDVGVNPSLSILYLDPGVFLYYLPSFLIEAFQDIQKTACFLEVIVPANRKKIPKGKWWETLLIKASYDQKIVIVNAVQLLEKEFEEQLLDSDREFILAAKMVWATR